MKRCRVIIAIMIFFVIALICYFKIVSYAVNNSEKNDTNLILTGEKIDKNKTLYKIVDNNKYDKKLLEDRLNEYINKISQYNNIDLKELEKSQYKIDFQRDELMGKTECVYEFSDFFIALDANNGNLIYYTEKSPKLKPCEINKEEIEKMSKEIFEQLDLDSSTKMQLTSVSEFTEEIWTAKFDKYYGELVNPGESIRISFSPQNKHIVNMVILNYTYENNEILISKDKAYEIAKEYMKKTSAKDMTVDIKIVQPNYYWYENTNEVYKPYYKLRKAYVFTCNNDAKVEIYVDCTTGEVIGGNSIIGGNI